MLNFGRSTVKHALQNIQNDCRQWLSHSFRVYQIGFAGGAYSAPQAPYSWFKRDLLLRGRKRKRGKRRERRGMEAERREREKNGPAPLTQIPGSVPEDCFKNVIIT